MFRSAGLHAGVHALARPSGAVCEAVAAARRRAATDGLHSVAGRPPISRVAGSSEQQAGLMQQRYFSAAGGVAGAPAPAAPGAAAPAAPGAAAPAAPGPPALGACCVSTCPLASATETNSPPGSPFFIGRPVTLTLSPAFTVFDFQPARTRNVGEVISKFHRSLPPLAFGTSTSSHACGLAHLNSLTTPSTVTVFV